MNAGGEFDTGHSHGRGCLLQRGVGSVDVQAHIVGCVCDGGGEGEVANEFEDKTLGVAVTEVETGGFEHEPF